MVLGLDKGNFYVKDSNHVYYKSGCKQISSDAENDSTIFYEGKLYSVGESRNAMILDKTQNEDMWIQCLPAIAEAIEKEGKSSFGAVKLAIGVPLKQYRQYKECYENYFKSRSCKFIYKGKRYSVMISDCKCYPQGFAAYLHHYGDLSQFRECNIIDIGGGTVDVFKVVAGKPVTSSFKSFYSGTISLVNDIAETLSNGEINVSEDMLCDAISSKELIHRRANVIYQVAAEKAEDYVKELTGQLAENGFDLDTPCVLIGGGAILLKDYLTASDKLYIVQTYDNFANADAFAWLMENGR